FSRALDRQRGEISTLLDGSLLAEAGLIDPDHLRRVAHSLASIADLEPLMSTVGCEIWLRSQERTPHHLTRTSTTALIRADAGAGQMVASSRSSPLDGRRPSVRSAK
ncbi:hypothetical protein AB4212_28130, partial [Streptomyces sp. 2MCAF27]